MRFSERQENACVKEPVILSQSRRRCGLEDAVANRGLRRTASVQEDWVAWLPEEKDRLFDATLSELEISYGILSVTLNDAFNLCRQGKLAPAREQARMFAELFDRLAGRLRGTLRSLYEHSRQFGTFPNTAPLNPMWLSLICTKLRSPRRSPTFRRMTSLRANDFRTPPWSTQRAPVPAQAMHFRKPRRSTPS